MHTGLNMTSTLLNLVWENKKRPLIKMFSPANESEMVSLSHSISFFWTGIT